MSGNVVPPVAVVPAVILVVRGDVDAVTDGRPWFPTLALPRAVHVAIEPAVQLFPLILPPPLLILPLPLLATLPLCISGLRLLLHLEVLGEHNQSVAAPM